MQVTTASLTSVRLWPQVAGTEGPFGTSNIQEQLLPFDLSIFKSLHQVEVRPETAGEQAGLSPHSSPCTAVRPYVGNGWVASGKARCSPSWQILAQ